MTPQDTNYDSLQVYYDFLEENNFSTEELREFASKVHWQHEYNYGLDMVGSDDGFEYIGGEDEGIGTTEGGIVGQDDGFDSVGTRLFDYPTGGVGNSSFG